MNQTEKTDTTRPQKIRLPFEKRQEDPGEWAYDHRIGLCVTVIVYLIVGIVFVSSKIMVGQRSSIDGFIIDIAPDPIETPQVEPEPKKEQEKMDFSNIKNQISNANAKELDAKLRDDKGTKASEIYDEADKMQDKIKANRETYERGLREEQALIDAKNASGKEDQKRQDVKVKGRVTVEFSLVNPIRSSMKLHIPAYQCEAGGAVVVNITVNHNGNVSAASIDKSQSTSDKCLTDMALDAARNSRFNIDSSAPDRHTGTISYIFIPQ